MTAARLRVSMDDAADRTCATEDTGDGAIGFTSLFPDGRKRNYAIESSPENLQKDLSMVEKRAAAPASLGGARAGPLPRMLFAARSSQPPGAGGSRKRRPAGESSGDADRYPTTLIVFTALTDKAIF
ncbi:hypothetical protein EVAR_44174_1 [Eumeta japonica]|uniref:Uncharacterized protein n=1 Tax=Eumeta variegata TaxID=151549 RepID=A0A4C1VZG5_EUMVA|nr:hypothetical protein EVAR_44174_1 [Eumeta japonica]